MVATKADGGITIKQEYDNYKVHVFYIGSLHEKQHHYISLDAWDYIHIYAYPENIEYSSQQYSFYAMYITDISGADDYKLCETTFEKKFIGVLLLLVILFMVV